MRRHDARAHEAWQILNELVGDLVTGVRIIDILDAPLFRDLAPKSLPLLKRISFFHLLVSLAKWKEFHERYKSVLPDDCRAACEKVSKELGARQILVLRNKYVAHIWDKDTGRPLTSQELGFYLDAMFNGNEKAFLGWIHDPSQNEFPKTVVSIAEHTRNRIAAEYNITHDAG